MTNKEQMKVAFIIALTDVFKDEDDRELGCIPKIDIENENGNDLILEMFYALQFVCNTYSEQQYDPLDFINVLTHLIFQEQKEQFSGVSKNEAADEKEDVDHETACSDE